MTDPNYFDPPRTQSSAATPDTAPLPQSVQEVTRVLQILVGAMLIGVCIFLGIAIFAVGALSQQPAGSLVSIIGAVMAVSLFGASQVVPQLVERAGVVKAQGRIPELLGVFRTKMILSVALLEGATFFNIIALIIEHNVWSLGVVAVLLVLMAMQFPNTIRIEHWLEAKLLESPAS